MKEFMKKYLFSIMISSTIVFLVFYAKNKMDKANQEKIEQIIYNKDINETKINEEKYPEYTSLSTMQILRLIPFNKPKISNFGANKNEDSIGEKYHIKGEIKKAFLYIDVAVDYDRCFTKYDNFFFSITKDKQNKKSGHIKIDNIKGVPNDLKCVFLYDLSDISYISSIDGGQSKNTHNNENFLSLFAKNNNISISAFISSSRAGRVMKEVSIYYECAEQSECLIEYIN